MDNSRPTLPTRRAALRSLAVGVALLVTAAPVTDAVAADAGTYTLTIHHLGRDGRPTSTYATHVIGVSGPGADLTEAPYDASGTTKVRLPKGRYLLDSTFTGSDAVDWLVQPRLDLSRDTTVTLDSRRTSPVDVRPPDASAEFVNSGVYLVVGSGPGSRLANRMFSHPEVRIGHVGPDAEPGTVRQSYDSYWRNGATTYALGYVFTGSRALDGLVRHPAPRDLAALEVRGAARPGSEGEAVVDLSPAQGPTIGVPAKFPVPATAEFLVTPERGAWDLIYQTPRVGEARPTVYPALGLNLRAGTRTVHAFDNAVLGPQLTTRPALVQDGDQLTLDVSMLADGDGHVAWSPAFDATATTLHRDGRVVGTATDAPGQATFTVPAGRADYRLTSSVERGGVPGAATKVTADWTFSTRAATTGPTPLPLSVVRFSPALRSDGSAPADAALRLPVTVRGAAADGRHRSLGFSYSLDGGATWRQLPLERGAVTVPATGRAAGVSLRAELTDIGGNTLTQTIVDAYRTR
ncbi:serine protease [Kitasatospora sp. NPDC051853]|uniref:serine protease n=1 Tax=Kitasatospora sp. NPDC051853 TaxID=3364058 RepID=UPI0037902D53